MTTNHPRIFSNETSQVTEYLAKSQHTGGGCWVDYISLKVKTENPDSPEHLYIGIALSDEVVSVFPMQDTPGIIKKGDYYEESEWLYDAEGDGALTSFWFTDLPLIGKSPSDWGAVWEYLKERQSLSHLESVRIVSLEEIYITLWNGRSVVLNATDGTFKPHTVDEYLIFESFSEPDEVGQPTSRYIWYTTNEELCFWDRVYIEALADGKYHVLIGNYSEVFENLQDAENRFHKFIYEMR